MQLVDAKQLYEFKKQLQALEKFRGRGTELISVYVTPKYPLSEITGKLRDEYGQASNIKSTSTRKNVQAALEKIIAYLKTFKQAPENGIAVFCGNVSEVEGRQDIQLYSIIPPHPLQTQFYRCESQFVLEPLREMVAPLESYGLVVIDGKEATVAVLEGKSIRVLKRIDNYAPQKTVKGGQSAARYDRIHEEQTEEYYKRVGEAMNAFVAVKNLKGVIVGGPGPNKEYFLKKATFDYRLKVLGTVDIGYTDEYGLRELLEKSGEIIAEQEAIKERKLFQEFVAEAVHGKLAVYGLEETLSAVESNKAARVLVSEEMELKEFVYTCENCGRTEEVTGETALEEKLCEECHSKQKLAEENDLLKQLIEAAEEKNIPIEFISQETEEGKQFRATFKGIGALLRYK
jgi:peptide chain release factor subunit 1